jgi:hypothetical protein
VEHGRFAAEARETVQEPDQGVLKGVFDIGVVRPKDHSQRRQESGRDGLEQAALGVDVSVPRFAGELSQRINRHRVVWSEWLRQPRERELGVPWINPHH